MNGPNDKFEYTYAAPTEQERREIESIRKAYLPDEAGEKLRRLRKLNARVRNTAMCVSLTLGVAGVLLFGAGMSLTLSFGRYAAGIALAALGIVPIALAYPVFNRLLRRGKKKYGAEILRLSEELLHGRK